jgi:hypothetical protein
VQQFSNLGLIRVCYARSFIVCDCTFRFLLIKHNDLFALAEPGIHATDNITPAVCLR